MACTDQSDSCGVGVGTQPKMQETASRSETRLNEMGPEIFQQRQPHLEKVACALNSGDSDRVSSGVAEEESRGVSLLGG